LKEIIRSYKSRGIKVILSGIREELINDFKKNDMFSILDKALVVKDIKEAIDKASEHE